MKKIISAFMIVSMLLSMTYAVYAEEEKYVIHVSLAGSDENTGKTEKSAVKSFSRINSIISAYRFLNKSRPIEVVFHGGDYYVSSSESIFSNSSESADVIYKAADGESVIFKGSTALDAANFYGVTDEEMISMAGEENAPYIYEMDISDYFSDMVMPNISNSGNPTVGYYKLIKNNESQTLSRYPNSGYIRIGEGDIVDPYTRLLRVPDGKFDIWSRYSGRVFVHGYIENEYAYERTYVTRFDGENGAIEILPVMDTAEERVKMKDKSLYCVYDVPGELDSNGEYYIDREKKKLYFYQKDGINIEDTYELSSLRSAMFTVEDSSNITFEGIGFENTCANVFDITRSDNIKINNCSFKNIQRRAIEGRDVLNILVSNCNFYNLGDTGVYLKAIDAEELISCGIMVRNCIFNKIAQERRSYSPAIDIRGSDAVAANNTISDSPHNAIGYTGANIKIINNDISNICKETGDVGAIYTGRNVVNRGCIIAGNRIQNCRSAYSSFETICGVYLDDKMSGTHIFNNIIKNAGRGIFINGGSDNSIHDNILIECSSAISIGTGGNSETSGHEIFEAGIEFLKTHEDYIIAFPTLKYIDPSKTLPRANLVCDNLIVNSGCGVYESNPYIEYGMSGRQNRRYNNTRVKTFSDFTDAENGDYSVIKSSPILKTSPNISYIDVNKIGVENEYNDFYITLFSENKNRIVQSLQCCLEDLGLSPNISKIYYAQNLIYQAEQVGIDLSGFSGMDLYNSLLGAYKSTAVDMSEIYNTSGIYSSDTSHIGAFYRNGFIDLPYWSKGADWAGGSKNIMNFNGVDFEFCVPDSEEDDLPCAYQNTGEYKNIDVMNGRYSSVEFMANSGSNTGGKLAVRLNYSDETSEISDECDVNYFEDFDNSENQLISEICDGRDEPISRGAITHITVPINSEKTLVSFDIINTDCVIYAVSTVQPVYDWYLAAAKAAIDKIEEPLTYDGIDDVYKAKEALEEAKANGVPVEDISNYGKYIKAWYDKDSFISVPIELSAYVNSSGIYDSNAQSHANGTGFCVWSSQMAIHSEYFKSLPIWSLDWTEDRTENILTNNGFKYKLKVKDGAKGESVVLRARYETQQYKDIVVDDGYYSKLSVLAGAEQRYNNKETFKAVLIYEDGSEEIVEKIVTGMTTNGENAIMVYRCEDDGTYGTYSFYIKPYELPVNPNKRLTCIRVLGNADAVLNSETGTYDIKTLEEDSINQHRLNIFGMSLITQREALEFTDINITYDENNDITDNFEKCEVGFSISAVCNKRENVEGAAVIIAVYDDRDRLKDLREIDISDDITQINEVFGCGGTKLKVFGWDSTNTLRPIIKTIKLL